MRSSLRELIPILLVPVLLLSACTAGGSDNSQTTYQISPSFRELYEKLGGEDVLGPAISKSFTIESFECQYTVSALICVNPQSVDSNRLFFYPLADAMGVREDPSQSPAQSGSTVIDGYTIYDEFLPLYNQLGGQYVGKPLTQAHINYSQQRIEQYFENVGFYRKFSDPSGSAHMLAYGAFSCTDKCNYTPLVETLVLNSSRASQDQPLLAGLSEMADTSILGAPLTQPYIASDGMEEQVYQNAVVYAPANDLGSARLRPLYSLLNLPQTEPVPQKYTSNDGMVFYATNGTKGYHVPLVFDHFIAAHGGRDFSGDPIDEVFPYSEDIYRQCFENYCLDYQASSQVVNLAPLGALYLEQGSSNGSANQPGSDLSSGHLVLSVSELSKQVAPGSEQQIGILVTRQDDQKPVANIEASLSISLPDGSQYIATFPATGLDGRASLVIPALDDIPNGTILEYQVCLKGADDAPVCVTDSYLIWPTQ
jgi:hypothetical protein